jgi:hypothetical protein
LTAQVIEQNSPTLGRMLLERGRVLLEGGG